MDYLRSKIKYEIPNEKYVTIILQFNFQTEIISIETKANRRHRKENT